jgi:hypothetical protein
MSTALSVANGAPSRVPVAAGPRGLQLGTLEEMWRFSQYVAKSGLAPKGMQSPEAVFVAIEMGAEIGMTAMSSIQNIAVINGRPAIWGDALLGVCKASGVFDEEAFSETISNTGEHREAICTVRRLPNGKPCTRKFSVVDAKAAQLWGKAGPWQQYPARMLQLRARAFALRDTFPDVLRGFRMAEEAQDYIDVPSVVAPPAAATSLEDLADKLAAPSQTVATVPTAEAEVVEVNDQGEVQEPFRDEPTVDEGYRIRVKEVLDELHGIADVEIAAEEIAAKAKTDAEVAIVRELEAAAIERIRGSRGPRSNPKS